MPRWIEDVQGYREILGPSGAAVQRRKTFQITGATVSDNGSWTVITVPAGATGATGAAGATGATGAGMADTTQVVLRDDFCGVYPGLTADGQFWGDRGPWTFDLIGGTAALSQRSTIEQNHPGQLSIATGPTTGEWAVSSGDGSAYTQFNAFLRATFVWRTSAALTSTITGLALAAPAAGNPNTVPQSAFFWLDPSTSANWRARTRDGSVQTADVDTGVAGAAADYSVFVIERNPNTDDLTFKINGSTVATVLAATHGIDATDTMKVAVYYDNNSASVLTPNIDLIIYESIATLDRTV